MRPRLTVSQIEAQIRSSKRALRYETKRAKLLATLTALQAEVSAVRSAAEAPQGEGER